MTKWFIHAVAVMVTTVFGISYAQARDPWSLDSEILFLRLHTAHGASQDDIFGFDPASRHSLSYLGCNNLGTRITFFQYDHGATFTAPGGLRAISLEMKNTDVEIFKRVNLTNLTAVEFGGGLRYSDNEVISPVSAPTRSAPNDFTGLGGLLQLRATAKVGIGGEFYARGLIAILGGNGEHLGGAIPGRQRFDEGRSHTEIAFGYQQTFNFAKMSVTPHAGVNGST